MSLLDTKHKRKSTVITTILMVLLIFLIFNFGMKYLDPPEEIGIAVNFGTTEVGSGDIQPTEPIKAATQEEIVEETEVEEVVEEIEETPVEESKPEVSEEKVVTQESEESIRMKQAEIAKRKAEEAEKKKQLELERKERARIAAAEKLRKEQEAKRERLDALMGGVNNSSGTASGGEGDDNQAGDKGKLSGDPYANSYYGDGGGGGSGGYGLRGRSLVRKGVGYQQECNEYGKVVVKIEVDKSGKVVKATPGVKGSTNTASCLLAPAKKSALSYKWNLDSKAPSKQIGFIIVNFN
jgi:outer membrane biosynthesis protein TonB